MYGLHSSCPCGLPPILLQVRTFHLPLGENHGVLAALLLTAVVNDRLINSHQVYLACGISPQIVEGPYSKLPLKEPGEFLAQGVGTTESGTAGPAS